MVNLSGLQVETLETQPARPSQAPPEASQRREPLRRGEGQVARENFDLLGFLYSCGFEPSQRLVFAREV